MAWRGFVICWLPALPFLPLLVSGSDSCKDDLLLALKTETRSEGDLSAIQMRARKSPKSVVEQCKSCCSGLNPTKDYCQFRSQLKDESKWCPDPHRRRRRRSTDDLAITSTNLCWSAVCPATMSNYVGRIAHKNKSLAKYDAVKKPLVPYRSLSYKDETGIFDLAHGFALTSSTQGGPAIGLKIGAAGDWGSGTCESRVIANLMSQDNPNLTFHLGDVYFVGDQEDFHYNVMGMDPPSYRQQTGVRFPKGSHTTFLMAGNHEQISGMEGLLHAGYTYSGQKANYGAWFSDHWRFIALDTGYLCMPTFPNGTRILGKETPAPLPDEVVEWLKTTVNLGDPSDKRGIVLMSHHFPYSDFEKAYMGAAQQLNDILPADRTIVWFFGHEHRFALYEKLKIKANHKNSRLLGNAKHFTSKFAMYGRMVGNGGYRITPEKPKHHDRNLKIKAWDMRTYQEIPHDEKLGFNGYFNISVTDDKLLVTYVSAKCKDHGCDAGYNLTHGEVTANETITVDLDSGKLTQEWHYVNTAILSTPEDLAIRSSHTEDLYATPIPWDADPAKQGVIYNSEHTSMD